MEEMYLVDVHRPLGCRCTVPLPRSVGKDVRYLKGVDVPRSFIGIGLPDTVDVVVPRRCI